MSSRIITVKDVRSRLSLPDDEGVNNSIKSCLNAALVRVSAMLRTGLNKVSLVNVFYVDGGIEVSKAGMFTLKLTRGFVQAAHEMNVAVGSTVEDVMVVGGESITGYFDIERGWVLVNVGQVLGKYVRVTCTCGFGDSDEPPDWLKEVVLALTIKMLTSQQISDGKAELSNAVPVLDQHILSILDAHKQSSSIGIPSIHHTEIAL